MTSIQLLDSPGDPSRFSFASTHIHFPDLQAPANVHSPRNSCCTSENHMTAIERHLLTAWSGSTLPVEPEIELVDDDDDVENVDQEVQAAIDKDVITPARQDFSIEYAQSVESLKQIAERQKRLEELQRAMLEFCAEQEDMAASPLSDHVDNESLEQDDRSLLARTRIPVPLRIQIATPASSQDDISPAAEPDMNADTVLETAIDNRLTPADAEDDDHDDEDDDDGEEEKVSEPVKLREQYGQFRKLSLGNTLQWHSSRKTYFYEPVTPAPGARPTTAFQQILSPAQLEQFDHEYTALVSTPVPPQRTNVLPPSPTESEDERDMASVTVKKFHLPAAPKYMESLLLQIDDPKVKQRLQDIDQMRRKNSRDGAAVSKGSETELPESPMEELPNVTEKVYLNDDDDKDEEPVMPQVAIPPRRHLLQQPQASAPRVISEEEEAEEEEEEEEEESVSSVSTSASSVAGPRPPQPQQHPTLPPTPDSLRPIPPARRSSMLPREQTPVNPHGSADHRGLPRLFIPPPPSTPPPARLTLNRMGVFDPSPQPAAQPITQGRQWGDPSNITSFVTPYHVAPTKMDCIGSVTQPVLVTSSWRGTAVPIHQIWKELDLDHTAGHDAARDARKEYKHGWGSLRTALRPTKKRPDLSVFGNPELPVSPSHRTATVYPSPPSSPPKPTSKSTGRGFGGSLARKMGQVMRTFEPTHPTIQEEQQQQQYNETLERRNRLRLGQDPAAVTYHPTIGKKRSSEMEEFRAMLLQTYADDK